MNKSTYTYIRRVKKNNMYIFPLLVDLATLKLKFILAERREYTHLELLNGISLYAPFTINYTHVIFFCTKIGYYFVSKQELYYFVCERTYWMGQNTIGDVLHKMFWVALWKKIFQLIFILWKKNMFLLMFMLPLIVFMLWNLNFQTC